MLWQQEVKVLKKGQPRCDNEPIKEMMEVNNMRGKDRITDALALIFLAIFAMPFLGGYLMLGENRETKFVGAILCFVGLVIWFLVGIN